MHFSGKTPSRAYVRGRDVKPQRKDAGGRKSKQPPNLSQTKPSTVQSTVGSTHQESDSAANNENATKKIDHQPSKNYRVGGISHPFLAYSLTLKLLGIMITVANFVN